MDVTIRDVEERATVVVARRCTYEELPDVIGDAISAVWDSVPIERGPGYNVVRYFGDLTEEGGTEIEIGVTIEQPGEPVGELHDGVLPAGRVATATHVGEYHLLYATHQAITAWCDDHDIALTTQNWEVYGDWSDDPAELRTEVFYLLA